jgi:hypothetical protein
MSSGSISADTSALASQAVKYLAVAQKISDISRQGLARIAAYDGVLGQGEASGLFLLQYRPADTSAREQLAKAGPALHDVAQAVYDWATYYQQTDQDLA